MGLNRFGVLKIISRLNIEHYNTCSFILINWRRVYTPVHRQCRCIHSVNSAEIQTVSVAVMKRTLRDNGISVEEGYSCLKVQCFLCKEKGGNVESLKKLFINKTTGFFVCQQCRCSGQWQLLTAVMSQRKSGKSVRNEDFPGLMKDEAQVKEQEEKRKKMLQSSTNVEKLSPKELQEVLCTFNLSNISVSTLKLYEARVSNDRQAMYFPLHDGDTRIGFKIIKKLDVDGATIEEVFPSGGQLMMGLKQCKRKQEIVLVKNTRDALAVAEKSSVGVLALPYGLKNLSQELLPTLEHYKKITLWFGNDIEAWGAARAFAKKLNEKRCHVVRPTECQPAPFEALCKDIEIKKILSQAQPISHQAITTFASLREDVLSELQNIEKVSGVKWKRYPALNSILKGHRRGELTVLTGPTGSGKTTLMSEYSLDLCMQGVNTLWGSFEIRNARLARTMLQQMAGIPLEKNLNLYDFWADKFEQLPLYFMTFHGQQPIKVVMEAVTHAVYVHDISHVVIDNLQFMMGMLDESRQIDRYWRQDVIIASFRNFATTNNCHVTLVIHPRKEKESEELTTSSIFGSAKATQEADNVLIIQDKRLTSLKGKKYLQVAKNRYSGDLGVMMLEFDRESLGYGRKKKPKEEPQREQRTSDQ